MKTGGLILVWGFLFLVVAEVDLLRAQETPKSAQETPEPARTEEKEAKKAPTSSSPRKRKVVSTPEPVKPFTVETLDSDKSGDVSKEEFIAYQLERLDAVFDFLDKDKDKKLDAVELDQMMRRSSNRPPKPPSSPSNP